MISKWKRSRDIEPSNIALQSRSAAPRRAKPALIISDSERVHRTPLWSIYNNPSHPPFYFLSLHLSHSHPTSFSLSSPLTSTRPSITTHTWQTLRETETVSPLPVTVSQIDCKAALHHHFRSTVPSIGTSRSPFCRRWFRHLRLNNCR